MDGSTDQRLEDARAHEQAEDFARQEKILKLISTELSKNTQRVVEMAVKNEVQNSVLPSLENITKTEVKAALGNQISKGLSESLKQVGWTDDYTLLALLTMAIRRTSLTRSRGCFFAPKYPHRSRAMSRLPSRLLSRGK